MTSGEYCWLLGRTQLRVVSYFNNKCIIPAVKVPVLPIVSLMGLRVFSFLMVIDVSWNKFLYCDLFEAVVKRSLLTVAS